jgi:predicted ribosome quality control (RQC) complex YloA/Tae2 family protein
VQEALDHIARRVHGARSLENTRNVLLARYGREEESLEQLVREQENLVGEFQNCEHLRQYGEFLLRELHQVPPRAAVVDLPDLETGEMVRIPLDPARTPAQNAQRYFGLYKRSKRGVQTARQRQDILQGRLDWVREQLWFTRSAEGAGDLAVLQQQLEKKPKHRKEAGRKPEKKPVKKMRPFLELDGCLFYVGRNGKQNQEVTFSVGKKGDLWFHALEVPGSHVVVKSPNGAFSEAALLRGAQLAAYFSFARDSGKVAVDYTDVGAVRKIPGAEPGRVYYTQQKTLYVNPQEAREFLPSLPGSS